MNFLPRVLKVALLLVLAGCAGGSADVVDVRDLIVGEVKPDLASGVDAVSDATVEDPPEVGTDLLPETTEGPVCPSGGAVGLSQVAFESGVVEGHDDGGVTAFLGIPYAAPPVGELRWRPPEPAACLDGVLDAASFGDRCPQIDAKTGDPTGSEDCLTLNIWTPDKSGNRPVLFFIHGGGNVQGAAGVPVLYGTKPLYGGSHLAAAHDVVVVTINYRLGALGFLALPELSDESAKGVSGNYGLLDILAALEWVQRNITAFGGDPGQVMVFGESAGAVNTCTMVATPLAKGLFHAALMESGLCVASALEAAEAGYGDYVAEQTGCLAGTQRLTCLRAKSPAELLTAMPPTVSAATLKFGFQPNTYGPLVDGWVLPDGPAALVEAGVHNDVPVVVGSNADEYHSLLSWPVPTVNAYTTIVQNALGWLGQGVVDEALALYPADAYDSPRDALVDLLTDSVFTCPSRQWARRWAEHGSSPVFRYHFTRRAVTQQGLQPAAHAVELLYVFGTMHDIPFFTPADADAELSAAMMGYWSRFGATGDPNGAQSVVWPAYDVGTDPYLRLDAEIKAETGLRPEKCDFWDGLQGG